MMTKSEIELAIKGLNTIVAINKGVLELANYYSTEKIIKSVEKVKSSNDLIAKLKALKAED